jgi:hypothetical protein
VDESGLPFPSRSNVAMIAVVLKPGGLVRSTRHVLPLIAKLASRAGRLV